ncbi:hypothetical protein P5673_016343 [Acropora cervicornis]|uniref:Uncharacterized protein n=1 Tax=Acropora cervicornis TaxID=6130 RepID=A0AAD9QG07_ACRCE|nr:hypothetical protein P5673_016343 [Acropora cervicornis]
MSGIFLPLMSGFADAEVTANIFKSLSKHPRANLKAVVLSSIQTKRGNKRYFRPSCEEFGLTVRLRNASALVSRQGTKRRAIVSGL